MSVQGRPEKKQERPEKNTGTSRKNTQLKHDVLADPLRVRDSYLVQKKDMDAENDLRPKNYSAGEGLECRTSRKTQERPEKNHTQLENGALSDSLGVRGSNLVQKKGMNAENGLRPKKKEKKK